MLVLARDRSYIVCVAFELAENLVMIVMGVSGSGKTTVGSALAQQIGATFLDADAFHSAANIEKMRQSIPLTAADRAPWIDAMVARLNQNAPAQQVLACSALTREIRARFRAETQAPVVFVYLRVEYAKLHERLIQRTGHYATVGLLASQLETLEEPQESDGDALVFAAESTPEVLAQHIAERLARKYPKQ
jgi:gluconokinase